MKDFTRFALVFTLIALGSSCFAQCSARCQSAFRFVISHEDRNLSGVVTAEPNGGYARFGINSKANHVAVRDGFYKMNRKRALAYAQGLFYSNYWEPIHGDDLSDRKLAFRMADLSFNLGCLRATILLQRAIDQQGVYVVPKGFFGYDTLWYANSMPPVRTTRLLKRQAHEFYVRLAEKYPVMNQWKGIWLERLAEEEEQGVPMPEWLADLVTMNHPEPIMAVDIYQWRVKFEKPLYLSGVVYVPCGRKHHDCRWGINPNSYRPYRWKGHGTPTVEVTQEGGEITR